MSKWPLEAKGDVKKKNHNWKLSTPLDSERTQEENKRSGSLIVSTELER